MKIKLLFFITLLPFLTLKAQTMATYVIGYTVTYDAAKLDKGLQKCTLDRYRKDDQRVIMKFEDGTKVELLSVNELRNPSAINKNKPVELKNAFILTPEGYIMERVKDMPSLEEQKRNNIYNQKNR